MSSVPSNQAAAAPFHVLMLGDGGNDEILDRKLQGDYISQRYRAFHEDPLAQKTTPTAARNNSLWLGVSPLEKALASCCEWPDAKGPDALVGGALVKEKVLLFIGIITLQCLDIGSRALGLAILERSMQVDEEERLAQVDAPASLESTFADAEPSKKRRRRDDSSPVPPTKPDNMSSPDRIEAFLAAGGLRILSRWLIDATTAVSVPRPKPPPGNNGRVPRDKSAPEEKYSPTGPLLLPLLEFLSNMAFDRQAVMQSKINKEIRKLSKEIDEIVQTALEQYSKVKLDALTDPAAGGMSVTKVQKALNKLKESWGLKAKKANPEAATAPDPFAALKVSLQERLETLLACESGLEEKPEWLLKVEVVQKEKEKKRPLKKRPSTEQLARRERENERSAMMKEDLRKAAQERSELLRKLREMKQKTEVDDRATERKTGRRGVQWRDGLGPASKLRKRDLLEEVFVFVKDNLGNEEDTEPATEPDDVENLGNEEDNEPATEQLGLL